MPDDDLALLAQQAPVTASETACNLAAARARNLAGDVSRAAAFLGQMSAARDLYRAAGWLSSGILEPAGGALGNAEATLALAAGQCRARPGSGSGPGREDAQTAEALEGFALRARELRSSAARPDTPASRILAGHRQQCLDLRADFGLTGISSMHGRARSAQTALHRSVENIDAGNPVSAAEWTDRAASLMTDLADASDGGALHDVACWLRDRCRNLADEVRNAYLPLDADGARLNPGDRAELAAPSAGGLYPAGTTGQVVDVYGDVVAVDCGLSSAPVAVARAGQVVRKPLGPAACRPSRGRGRP